MGAKRYHDGRASWRVVVRDLSSAMRALETDVAARAALRVCGTRVWILHLLRERPLGVCAVARAVGIHKSAAYKHLQLLVASGSVVRVASGRWVFYHLAGPVPGAFMSGAGRL